MSIFRKLFNRQPQDDSPIGHPVNYEGPAPYGKSFTGTGFGVVFEDDGETGYLYATNESHDEIFDALHLYNVGDVKQVKPGDEVFIVWNPSLMKAGIFYHQQFQAIIDFKKQRACCRTGFPPPNKRWCKSSHEWDEMLVTGLEP